MALHEGAKKILASAYYNHITVIRAANCFWG
jgi:hypothetical protein